MKIKKWIWFVLVSVVLLGSCTKPDIIPDEPTEGENPEEEIEVGDQTIKNFIWKGMNFWYLYKANVAELGDTHFGTPTDLNDYLAGFETPEALFYDGLVDKPNDRFSFLVSDYVELEKSFNGTETTTGMNYGLGYIDNTSDKLVGFVRYIAPDSPAASTDIKRGDVFTKIDGIQLTDSNYRQLMAPESFTVHLAEIKNGTFPETGKTITLTKAEYTENPILIAKTLEVEGRKIGYLLYNSFVDQFDDELNEVFAKFKTDNITDLVLDLRYNGGGYVESAVDLASMITGQFKGEVFLKKQFNADIQSVLEQEDPEYLIDRFNEKIRTGEAINSLNLSEVFIIATGSSASASELVINSLEPYITVNHIGTKTVGKFQASATFYDSEDLGQEGASTEHAYAIQPLIFKSSNANGKSDFVRGLVPDIEVIEYVEEFSPLGDPAEPLLAAAISAITGQKSRISNKGPGPKLIMESGQELLNYQRMYIENLPSLLIE